MLPKIVQKSSQHASKVLRLFAKYSNQNRREMMFYNFKYIFSYLVRLLSKESDLENCLRYLQVLIKTSLILRFTFAKNDWFSDSSFAELKMTQIR